MQFVVTQSFTRKVTNSSELESHIDYVKSMVKKGLIVITGPFADEEGGGMYILDVDNIEIATELVNSDPMTISGDLISEIRPYNMFFIKKM